MNGLSIKNDGLSISRGDDLTPEQPTIDENIAKANEMLDKYGDELDRDEIPMWLTNIIISIFQKGDENFMNEIILQVIKTIIEDTDIDDYWLIAGRDFYFYLHIYLTNTNLSCIMVLQGNERRNKK
jgi:hypothetical protein